MSKIPMLFAVASGFFKPPMTPASNAKPIPMGYSAEEATKGFERVRTAFNNYAGFSSVDKALRKAAEDGK